ncbi:DUF2268 domain-containing putative Zn-dependent protease [Pectobacterium atrosepticum]|uniref:DUF2268 domain-containing putative Zn-dependent protease n=1 Tax=Pectobacterium atrosepticum TaxID=29471 RepID=UPI00049ACAA4|nr:DUF2268 domain-containing putative Zn-dependent protease [Pectobacterium atrosepticum]AIA71806.1 peptidase [Pectobacterium atrosepticum]AIK14764.1 hypothetical protein GZ59_29840 [Pectobacterium atrosepticum]POW31355.1 peptidase [Pectobacterium atrosepticum]
MSYMKLHILNAQDKLTAQSEWLNNCLTETYTKASILMNLPSLDIIVKAGTQVIPEKGHLGYSPEPGIVYITVDPEKPSFCSNPNNSLERMLAHELHHAARWAGPGYGFSLGEAIVSEGLAGHFTLELFGGEPEPWECLDEVEVQSHILLTRKDWDCTDYDHNAWFYGTSNLPRWLGYTLGFNLVTRFLLANPHLRASTLTNVNAEAFKTLFRTEEP